MESAIAALNDKQRFNSQQVATILELVYSGQEGDQVENLLNELASISKNRNGTMKGETAQEMRSYLQEVDLSPYQDYHSELRDSGVEILNILDSEYPEKLTSIDNPPLCIYVDGDLSSLHRGVTIVGTRSATDHRIEMARKIAKVVVQELETTVISGLANGIDETAHEEAIDKNGKTVAALPGDVENIKPSSNTDLGKRISDNGGLVSEVSKFAGFHKGRYLERNRITSGLSDAVVVVASKDSGGTVKQAELAQKQGKPRYLYDAPESDGQTPERLINQIGFQKFESVDELLDLLKGDSPEKTDSQGNMTFDNF